MLDSATLEKNCQALYHSISCLDVYPGQNLIRQSWSGWVIQNWGVVSAPARKAKEQEVLNAVLSTLQAIRSRMNEKPPICYYVESGRFSHLVVSYKDIADKVIASPRLRESMAVQEAAKEVLITYQAVSSTVRHSRRRMISSEIQVFLKSE